MSCRGEQIGLLLAYCQLPCALPLKSGESVLFEVHADRYAHATAYLGNPGKGGVLPDIILNLWENLEASPGIEPGCKDLQSSA